MMTKEQARTSNEFHVGECFRHEGPRGGVTISQTRVRASGKLQEWVRAPHRFRLPIKYGLYGYGEITDLTAHEFHTAEDCPLR